MSLKALNDVFLRKEDKDRAPESVEIPGGTGETAGGGSGSYIYAGTQDILFAVKYSFHARIEAVRFLSPVVFQDIRACA